MNLVPTIYGLIAGLVTGPMILAAVTQAGAASELQGTKDVLRDGPSLAEFVDRIVTNRMREFRVPGAVVTVVRGDRVLVNKGYGFADLEDRRPVDPERTLFRIASVSKVFNAMAVMRLVDEGLIGIDEDVRPRLRAAGLELDTTAEGPITLKALLTHTAGIRDLSTPDLDDEGSGQAVAVGSLPEAMSAASLARSRRDGFIHRHWHNAGRLCGRGRVQNRVSGICVNESHPPTRDGTYQLHSVRGAASPFGHRVFA